MRIPMFGPISGKKLNIWFLWSDNLENDMHEFSRYYNIIARINPLEVGPFAIPLIESKFIIFGIF